MKQIGRKKEKKKEKEKIWKRPLTKAKQDGSIDKH